MNLIDIDQDSLDSILSYCPNRGCFELQSLKNTSKALYLLLSGISPSSSSIIGEAIQDNTINININDDGNGDNDGSNPMSVGISKTIKEVLNCNLLKRIEEVYLPRLYYQISYTNFTSKGHSAEERKNEIMLPTLAAFEQMFGDHAVRRISLTEFEVDFVMEDDQVYDRLEQLIDREKSIDLKKPTLQDLNSIENSSRLIPFKNQNGEIDKTLNEIYKEWKEKPLVDSNMIVNPFRLARKTILHFSVWASTFYENNYRLRGSYGIDWSHDSLPLNPTESTCNVNLRHGLITDPPKLLYKFNKVSEGDFEGLENTMKQTIYYFLSHRCLERMERIKFDLKQLLDTNTLNYLTQLEREDQYYYLTVRDPILKKVRDGLTGGNIQFDDVVTETKFLYNKQIDYKYIPYYLSVASLDTMNDYQRLNFLKQFIKFVYYSSLELPEQQRQQIFERLGIDHRANPFTCDIRPGGLHMNGLSLTFERNIDALLQHKIEFPSFPCQSISKLFEQVSIVDLRTRESQPSCCSCFSNIFRLCNTLIFHRDILNN